MYSSTIVISIIVLVAIMTKHSSVAKYDFNTKTLRRHDDGDNYGKNKRHNMFLRRVFEHLNGDEDSNKALEALINKRVDSDRKMSGKPTARDTLVAKWYFEDEFGYRGELLDPESIFLYMKALIKVVSGDGVLSEAERRWIVGNAALCGAPQQVLDELNSYRPDDSMSVKEFFHNVDSPILRATRLTLLYDGFKAASADDELASEEIEAIETLGETLGVTDEELKKVRALFEENAKLRQKRSKVLFPDGGVKGAVDVLNELH